MNEFDYGPEMPDLFAYKGSVVRLDYIGAPENDEDDSLGLMIAESGGSYYMPSTYALTEVATGEMVSEFLVFGEGGFSPYEMAFHLATGREGAEHVAPAPSMNESLTCEHGMDASLCAGPGHYPMDGGW